MRDNFNGKPRIKNHQFRSSMDILINLSSVKSEQGKLINLLLFKLGMKQNFFDPMKTIKHIMEECLITKFGEGIAKLHQD